MMEKQDNWLWEITQITQKAKGSRKRTQPQLTRKTSKKMEKRARRNIMSQTPAWEPPHMENADQVKSQHEEISDEWTLKQ